MRIVVLGTGPFAVPMFQSLLDSPHQVVALVTRPTPPAKGREKTSLNPMRDLAVSRGLAVHAPESINSDEAVALLRSLAVELLVVCDYGQILSPAALGTTPLGGINLHASLLPKYRGAAPIHWAIWSGETETGVSVIHMTPRLDGGPILAVRSTPIGPDEIQPELESRLARLGDGAVAEAIAILANWDRVSSIGTSQDTAKATKAPRLKKEQGAINWSKSASQIQCQVRAFQPWPGSYTFWHRAGHEPVRLVIEQVALRGAGLQPATSSVPGQVLLSDGKQLHIATAGGVLAVLRIQPAGKRVMAIDEFLRGHHVREGDVFRATSDIPPGLSLPPG